MSQRTGKIDRTPNSVDGEQLLEAVLFSALQYGNACRRFARRRKLCGHDYGCARLLDEISLRRSLLHLLAEEARASVSAAVRSQRRSA